MKRAFALCLLALVATSACQEPAQTHQKDASQVNLPSDQTIGPTQTSTSRPQSKSFLAIQAIALAAVPGEVLQVDLENEDGQDIYEIKILTQTGRVIEIEVEAATGSILKQEVE
ncbi:MAG: PepSY domain-containing protein [bacterium]|jgi:uncharacterized membrane protein YkoI